MNTPQRAHADMVTKHGTAEGRCEDCLYFIQTGQRPHPRTSGSIAIMGCRKFNLTHAYAPPRWSAKWPACGLLKRVQ